MLRHKNSSGHGKSERTLFIAVHVDEAYDSVFNYIYIRTIVSGFYNRFSSAKVHQLPTAQQSVDSVASRKITEFFGQEGFQQFDVSIFHKIENYT